MDARSIEQSVVIIGGGPAGLMAADVLSKNNVAVTVIDSQKRVGKKFLVAGDGGLNLTHSEPLENFVSRYQDNDWAQQIITQYTPTNFIEWLHQLGITTFVGSSGRIFPEKQFKPAQVLQAWIGTLTNQGVKFITNTQLTNINYPQLTFEKEGNSFQINSTHVIFAMGGKSWKKTGSTGSWTRFLNHEQLLPSNLGLHLNWSPYFISNFEGDVLKYVAVTFKGLRRLGDIVITKSGLESTPIYHISGAVVQTLASIKKATIIIDLKPNQTTNQLLTKVNSNNTWQQCFTKWKLHNSQKALYVEVFGKNACSTELLVERIKNIPLTITDCDTFDKAIATQGGIPKNDLTNELAFKNMPNWYAAGEMLNQDAPTGGYLIQHAVSSGYVAAQAIINKLT